MLGLAILLGFNLVGLLLEALGAPLPGPVIGLILFTACLFLRIVKLKWVEDTAEFLLRHMLLLFAPVVVHVVVYRDRIVGEWPAMSAGIAGGMIIAMLVTGWAATLFMSRSRGKHELS
jgi:holin-like protein